MTGLIDFSINADENNTAAAPVLWSEGMPAKAVNNSSREEMAALARWHADNCGALGATIAGNAVSVATNQGFKASHLARGFRISFSVPQANTGPVTLNIDGIGARPWRRPGGFEFGPADIEPFAIHDVVWSIAQGAFVSQAPDTVRPGKIDLFGSVGAIPPGWVECDGRELSRANYAALFAAIGTTWGPGNGTTTFNVPPANGRAFFGRDSGAGRLTGAGGLSGGVGNVGGSETVALALGQMPSHSHTGSTGAAGGQAATSTGAAGGHNHGGSTGNAGGHNHTGTTGGGGGHSHGGTTSSSGGHIHDLGYEKLSIYGGSGGLTAVSQLFPPGNNSTGATNGAGEHQHNITTDPVGDHAHNFTTSGVGDHAHSVPDAPNHSHSIPAIPDHSHTLTVNPSGNGEAHPNMPPGLVGVFAIKA